MLLLRSRYFATCKVLLSKNQIQRTTSSSMRSSIFITLLFATSQVVFGQKFPSKMDRLDSENEVQKFIRSIDKDYEQFKLKPITEFTNRLSTTRSSKIIEDSLGINKSFCKADFDNNGYTDLLAIGDYYRFTIFVVMNYGHDSLVVNPLTRRSFQQCTFPKIINDTILRYYYFEEPDRRQSEQLSTFEFKDLIFRFGDFIEYNPHPGNLMIEKIEYTTTGCYGACPIFDIGIQRQIGNFNSRGF